MSKTKENLKAAVAGESLARNRYSYFAIMAEKEGYLYIAKIFEEIAENEKYHAMEELKLLMGDRDTLTNLKESVDGEQYEFDEMYPRYATEAEVEGNRAATILFQQISKIERQHYDRFKKLLEMVEAGKVFKRMRPRLHRNRTMPRWKKRQKLRLSSIFRKPWLRLNLIVLIF